MGWQWLEGDTGVPELTERGSFREVLLKERLAAALRKLNRRDGQPWLDEACAVIRAKDATKGGVLEAPLLIAWKARA